MFGTREREEAGSLLHHGARAAHHSRVARVIGAIENQRAIVGEGGHSERASGGARTDLEHATRGELNRAGNPLRKEAAHRHVRGGALVSEEAAVVYDPAPRRERRWRRSAHIPR